MVNKVMNKDDFLRLTKNCADEILFNEPELQKFLIWINQKSNLISLKSSYKPAAIRAFYFSRSFSINYDDAIDDIRRYDLAPTLEPALAIADTLNLDPKLAKDINDARQMQNHLATALSTVSEDKIAEELVKLFCKLGYYLELQEVIPALLKIRNHFYQSRLNDLFDIERRFKKWWRIKRRNWAEELLYSVKNLPDDLTRKRNFNDRQKKLLQKYYDANRLLVQQMNQSKVNPEVRQEIEDSLLLPAKSI